MLDGRRASVVQMRSRRQSTNLGSERASRAELVRVAEKLFAERGIHGVGMREIVAEAGHKNAGSIRHHFGSKDNLIREIMIEGLRRSEQWRIEQLDELERSHAKISIRDLLLILVGPVRHNVVTETFMVFLAQVALGSREFYEEVINKEIQVGTKCCVDYLRAISRPPSDEYFDNRMALLSNYLMAYLNSQYRGRSAQGILSRSHVDWRSDDLLEHFLETAEGILRMPSPATAIDEKGAAPRVRLTSPRAAHLTDVAAESRHE